MPVCQVLKLAAIDVDDQKLLIRNPRSGKELEGVFIPKKLADRLKDYLKTRSAEETREFFLSPKPLGPQWLPPAARSAYFNPRMCFSRPVPRLRLR